MSLTQTAMNLLTFLITVLCATTMSGCTGNDVPLFEKPKESVRSYELPAGWEWRQVDGVTYPLTAIRYNEERTSEEVDCDCPVDVDIIEIRPSTPPGTDEDAKREMLREYEAGKSSCDYERQYQPDVGDCGLMFQELRISNRSFYVYLGQGMHGPVSYFAFVKDGKVVHGSVTGRVDEHVSELETVINTLVWR